MDTSAPGATRARLGRALVEAMRTNDVAGRSAIRSALAILDNAAAIGPPAAAEPSPRGAGAGQAAAGGPIAGARHGVGSTEVSRREVPEEEARALLEADLAERRDALALAEREGRDDLVDRLRAELGALERVLG